MDTWIDGFMGIFGFKRVTMDKAICLGINCKIKKKCARYGVKANTQWQSYIATCKDKIAFIGKPRRRK